MTALTKAKLREGGRKRWEGVSPEERSRAMKRARKGRPYRTRKPVSPNGKQDDSK